MSSNSVRLTCRQCQARKIRCNKSVPCLACLEKGLDCTAVERQRLPRGRSGTKAASRADSLNRRIAQLEGLMSSLKNGKPQSQDSKSHASNVSVPLDAPPTSIVTSPNQPIALDFWNGLRDAVDGLRSVLDDESAEDVEAGQQQDEAPVQSRDGVLTFQDVAPMIGPGLDPNCYSLLFGTLQQTQRGDLQAQRAQLTGSALLATYQKRFDTVFKLLHWPSTFYGITNTNSNPAVYSEADARVLHAALCFGAVCTMSVDERPDKAALVEDWRSKVEVLLTRSGLLTSTSLAILQAFVIYLAALRTCQANSQQWTLLSLAVRIATAQGLHTASQSDRRDLRIELKRRLWYCIGMLDLQSAFDRGSPPMLHADDFLTLPLDIDDAALSSLHLEENLDTTQTCSGFTDMTFCSMTHRAMICQHNLISIRAQSTHGLADSIHAFKLWRDKQTMIISEFEGYVNGLSQRCQPFETESSIEKFTMVVARESLLSMRLLLRRPLHKTSRGLDDAEDDFDLLQAGTEILESASYKLNPEFRLWAWYSWTKWYALAIVLSELCTRPRHEMADRAWLIAQDSFDSYKRRVADAESGLLWKPIAKLMHRACNVRQAGMNKLIDQQIAKRHEGISKDTGSAVNTTPLHDCSTELVTSNGISYNKRSNPVSVQDGPFAADHTSSGTNTVQSCPSNHDCMASVDWDLFLEDLQEGDSSLWADFDAMRG